MTSKDNSQTPISDQRTKFLERKGFRLSEVATQNFTLGIWSNPAYIAWSTLRMQVEFCQETMKNFKSQVDDEKKSSQTLREIKENAVTIKKNKKHKKSGQKISLK